ncbi:Pet127-domain-containing protein [Myriangium duriaei CBS 260.36]|uniref:Pet127-domain-containing protein n=1 Tax=Myriangium duriaei CBS 260.36 TaxID=1168546 RepID=A0A9P4J0C3_9PEZI|nr:Pet127-domain-containing protein [Myriangium duriaei CBS 260.36]
MSGPGRPTIASRSELPKRQDTERAESQAIDEIPKTASRKGGFSNWISGFVKSLREPNESSQSPDSSSNSKVAPHHPAQAASVVTKVDTEEPQKPVAHSASAKEQKESRAEVVNNQKTSKDGKKRVPATSHVKLKAKKAKGSKPSAKEPNSLTKLADGLESTEKHGRKRHKRAPLIGKLPVKSHSKETTTAFKPKDVATTSLDQGHVEQKATVTEPKSPQDSTEKSLETAATPAGAIITEDTLPKKKPRKKANKQKKNEENDLSIQILPKELPFTALQVEQPPVPRLAHNLDRVLFNRGVYSLRDRHSGVYNFDPYLENIMPATEFNFNAIPAYKTSSEDEFLSKVAEEHDLRYVGSTSSMTSMLTHFHYLLSHWRELDLSMLSRGFGISGTKNSRNFTEIYRSPQAIFLRYKNGRYAIDADKEFSTPNILMHLGQSLEKLLTLPADTFERFRRSDSRGVPHEKMDSPQSFHYSKQGKILMRSQLDAYDPRLPGSGVFDLKTRAVLPIRMSSREYQDMVGYQILSDMGTYESYEREFYDMFRSTFLKYSLQVRMGRMEGIFVAYHNVEEIFGFQFMNLGEMDRVLHGQEDPSLGDQEFRASLAIVHDILDQATAEFPEKSIRLHFDTRAGVVPMMYIFAEPMEEEDIEKIQNSGNEAMMAFEREIKGESEPTESEAVAPSAKSKPITLEAEDSSSSIEAAMLSGSDPAAATQAATENSEPAHKPLLAWTLTTTSLVNGAKVSRPESLSPNDKWELKYDLHRIADAEKAATWYNMTKNRRRSVLDWGSDDETPADEGNEGATMEDMMKGVAEEPKKKRRALPAAYLNELRAMAKKGRAIREERLREMEGKGKVVVGLEGLKNSTPVGEKMVVGGGEVPEGEVKDVKGYMEWLYRK